MKWLPTLYKLLTSIMLIFEFNEKINTTIMKKILMIIALAAVTTGFAQENKNEKKETIVTKTAVKSEKGTDVSSKAVTKTEKQVVSLSDMDANQTNQTMLVEPTQIKTDVDYDYNGNRFKFINQKDENGYRMMTVKDNATNEEYAIIKPTSKNGYYILSQKGKSSFGYMNENGDFVVESYDADKDAVISTIYKINSSNMNEKPMDKDSMDMDKN